MIHIAPPAHLLAMKLVAGRRQDTPDVVALVVELEMTSCSAEDFADLLAEVYDGEELLSTILGIPGAEVEVRAEALAIGRWAVAQVARLQPGP